MDDHTTETVYVHAELKAIRRRLDALAKLLEIVAQKLNELAARTPKSGEFSP